MNELFKDHIDKLKEENENTRKEIDDINQGMENYLLIRKEMITSLENKIEINNAVIEKLSS